MPPKIMRQVWSVVEKTQTKTLLHMDDASLVKLLVKQTKNQAALDCHEADYLGDYIQSRLPLIRDIAHQRQYNLQSTFN